MGRHEDVVGRWWASWEQLALPPRGTAASARLDGHVVALMASSGGLIMLGLAPLVVATAVTAAAGVLALVVAGWALALPDTAPAAMRSANTAAATVVLVLGVYGFEHGTSLRLGAVSLLLPVVVTACLRSPREVVAQALWAQAAYGAYLASTIPLTAAVVGMLGVGAVMAMIGGLISGLRGRLDHLVDDLRTQAETDPLTGLNNRTGLGRAVGRAGSSAGALLLLDLDHFKRINDEHGHQVGDGVLVWLAALLVAQTRPGDVVARHGGEEFVVYLPGPLDPGELRARAEHLREQVELSSRVHGLPITVSIGVAYGASCDLPALLRAADVELYAAKHAGRNLVRLA